MYRKRLYLAVIPLVFCLSCALQFAARSPNPEGGTAKDTISLKLHVTPMTSLFSTQIIVSQGNARAFRYSPTQPAVFSIHEGKIPTDVETRLRQQTIEAAFAAACDGQKFGVDGLTRGDQFQLLVSSEPGTERRCAGFIEDAPMNVRQVISDLLKLPQQLAPVSLASSYLRSEVVTAERLAAIRRAGQMRFVSLPEVVRDLQPLLSSSVAGPGEFIPLSRQQFDAIRTLIAPAYEFILTSDGSGSQLTLFPTQAASSSKGEFNESLTSRPPPGAQVSIAWPGGIASDLRAADYSSRR